MPLRRLIVVAAVSCLSATITRGAEAQGFTVNEPKVEIPKRDPWEPERVWYGWQVFLSDVGHIVVVAGLANSQFQQIVWPVAIGGYFGGPVLVHLANDQMDSAWKSPVFRLGVPVGGAVVMAPLGPGGVVLGGLVGLVVAPFIDYFFLSTKTVPNPDAPPPIWLAPPQSIRVVPDLQLRVGSVSIGLAGSF